MFRLNSLFPAKFFFLAMLLGFAPFLYALNCLGTIYFKAPSHWDRVYGVVGSKETRLQKNEDGWYEISASSLSGSGFAGTRATTFLLTDGDGEWVDASNFATDEKTDKDLISCSDFNDTRTLYIYEGEKGKTVLSNKSTSLPSFRATDLARLPSIFIFVTSARRISSPPRDSNLFTIFSAICSTILK